MIEEKSDLRNVTRNMGFVRGHEKKQRANEANDVTKDLPMSRQDRPPLAGAIVGY